MLIIYHSLRLGGIETFFIRMAKERKKMGLNTKILLLSDAEKSDKELIGELKKYASVFFKNDFFVSVPLINNKFPLIFPIKKNALKELMKNVDQIHVFTGMHALLAYRLNKMIKKRTPITVGFYHYIIYAWGDSNIAYHERINRKFIFEYLPNESLSFFSKGNRDFYENKRDIDLSGANTFRLGVVDEKEIELTGQLNKVVKICSVGRLVEFKTYNLFMLDVIKSLKNKGFEVQYDIYGSGPFKSKIESKVEELELDKNVHLKGQLKYSKFDTIVSDYDLFVGSGTAIIQAASLGVSSIVGIENMMVGKTYGYFSDVYEYEYNLKGLDLPLKNIDEMIVKYITTNDDKRLKLKERHVEAAGFFSNENCVKSMEKLKNIEMPKYEFEFNLIRYEFSRLIDKIKIKFNKNHPWNRRHENIKRTG